MIEDSSLSNPNLWSYNRLLLSYVWLRVSFVAPCGIMVARSRRCRSSTKQLITRDDTQAGWERPATATEEGGRGTKLKAAATFDIQNRNERRAEGDRTTGWRGVTLKKLTRHKKLIPLRDGIKNPFTC